MAQWSLQILPVEVHYIIFDYLDTPTILHSVARVCDSLSQSVRTYNRFKLDFSTLSESDCELVPHIISPSNIISLSLCDDDLLRPSSSTLFVSWFEPYQFVRLQSLVLSRIPEDVLKKFIQHIRPGQLKSLSLAMPDRETQSCATLLHDLSQTTLEEFNLDISNIPNAISSDVLLPIASFLRSLVVNVFTYRDYCTILQTCIHLHTLELSNWLVEESDQLLPNGTTYPQLISLTVNRYGSRIDRLFHLLSLTPALIHLTVLYREPEQNHRYDGHWWESLIQSKLPSLEEFQLFLSYRDETNSSYYDNRRLKSISRAYRTPFWRVSKRWIVTFDYVLTSRCMTIYTTPLPTADVELIVRYDPSATDKYRLFSRRWSNGEFVEQTPTEIDCEQMRITENGAMYLTDALQFMTGTSLVFRETTLPRGELHSLARVLQQNTTLTNFGFERRIIESSEIASLAQAISNNTTLTRASFGHGQIGTWGAECLAKMLEKNTVLLDLNIGNNQIGDQGAEFLANALTRNKTLKSLDLDQNAIGVVGAQHIAVALEKNSALETLSLLDNTIGDKGAQHMAEMLLKNLTLKTLILSYNRIDASGIQSLMEALKNNQTLTTLDLGGNTIEPSGAEHIASALKENKTLVTLILSFNQIRPEGTKHLANALRINQNLKTLDLRANNIGVSGAEHLSDALHVNTTLTTLNLRGNRIQSGGCQYIGKMLQANQTLLEINLENNEIRNEGARSLAEALQSNKTLTTLLLANNNIEEEEMERLSNALKHNAQRV